MKLKINNVIGVAVGGRINKSIIKMEIQKKKSDFYQMEMKI